MFVVGIKLIDSTVLWVHQCHYTDNIKYASRFTLKEALRRKQNDDRAFIKWRLL